MTETEMMKDMSDEQTGQSPLEAMAEHIRDSGAVMLLACDVCGRAACAPRGESAAASAVS